MNGKRAPLPAQMHNAIHTPGIGGGGLFYLTFFPRPTNGRPHRNRFIIVWRARGPDELGKSEFDTETDKKLPRGRDARHRRARQGKRNSQKNVRQKIDTEID